MLNHSQFIDRIISKLDLLVEATGMNKALALVEIGQMLVTLQNGIQNDEKNHKEAIDNLQGQIDELTKQLNGNEPVEKVVLDMSPKIEEQEDSDGNN